MREIRQSGSEGGARFNPVSLPLFTPGPKPIVFRSIPNVPFTTWLELDLKIMMRDA